MLKTCSFGVLHMSVAFSVAWLISGSFLVGGAIALVEPLINTVVFYFHEKFWEGRKGHAQQQHVHHHTHGGTIWTPAANS